MRLFSPRWLVVAVLLVAWGGCSLVSRADAASDSRATLPDAPAAGCATPNVAVRCRLRPVYRTGLRPSRFMDCPQNRIEYENDTD